MNWIRAARRKAKTAGKLCSQAAEAARSGGFGAAAAFCVAKARAITTERRLGNHLPGARVSAGFDSAFGVDTGGAIGLSDLQIDSPNYLYGTLYKASDPERFREIVRAADVQYEDYTFVDLGSGKGLALLLASEFPFQAVRGVEFARELHEVAEKNMRRFRNANQKCWDILSIHGDAAKYEFPNEPLLIYLYHPFEAEVLDVVVSRLEESHRRSPRPIVLAYAQPAAAGVLQRWPFLELVKGEGVSLRDGAALAAYQIYRASATRQGDSE